MSKMLITEKQYNHLSNIGREIHEYWMKYKPTMYQEMHEAGTLWEIISSEDNRLLEMMCSLITEQGLAEDQAWEIIRAEIYVDPEEIEEELEETEQDRRSQEMWELFVEARHLQEEANALRYERDENQSEETEFQELNARRDEYIEDLNTALEAYCSVSRKSKRVLEFILFICVVALYFLLSDLFGRTLGFILTFIVLAIAAYCISTLEISFKNTSVSDGKLAYHACIAMEALIEIKNGTYSKFGFHIIGIEEGKHQKLYKEFAQLYPELASQNLKRLARITVTREDMYD